MNRVDFRFHRDREIELLVIPFGMAVGFYLGLVMGNVALGLALGYFAGVLLYAMTVMQTI